MRILIVDDEPNIRAMLRVCLEPAHQVEEAGGVAEALVRIREDDFDLAMVDMRLGDGVGLQVLAALPPTTSTVVMTAFGTIETAVQAMREGASDYLQKPFTAPQVTHAIERLAHERSRDRELEELRAHFAGETELVAESDSMKQLQKLAARAAASDVTVLLRGESGTGKGVWARWIHQQSSRAKGPFIAVDLSTTGENLEAELFGRARTARTGRLEAAQGGTLFLDGIGDLPLSLQPKLLRVVQERSWERVGEHVTRQGDLRIVAAATRDLKQMVVAGTFREDLYYRLKVFELDLPPLRARRDDILPLADRFLQRSAQRARRPVPSLSPAARRILQRYDWPGNLRELRNVLERAAILADGPVADADLFAAEREATEAERASDDPEGESLAAAERRHIARIIAKYPTMEEAARVLGIDVVTLWRRRKKYKLD
jgi:NtrC-family two-component system response regulator AlgB